MSKQYLTESIGQMVREAEQNYLYGKTISSKYVSKSMYEDIQRIDAYISSKHITGDTDSLGREKPFFNIVTAAVNVWYRATDIDRKDIKIKPTKSSDTFACFLATVHLQDWMRKEDFGRFLNDWGRGLARYGSQVVKFVEKEGRLIPSNISWQRLIVDPIDFDNNIKIELIELTEAQLYQRDGYNKEEVERLCETRKARESLDGLDKDTKSDYIKLYEVHGLLPLSLITQNEDDEDTYVQQMHVISFVAGKDGEYTDFILYRGREEKDPYMITHLIKEDGQTLSIGAVEHLFEAQWMVNHSMKTIKDHLDLASKLIFQTADGNFVGRNALTSIEHGDILTYDAQFGPLTQLNNSSHDISTNQSFTSQWKQLGNEVTNISESMLGNSAPSGTAWRQVEALLQESHSLFELMVENKGIDLEKIFRTYVIPFIKKKMDSKDEISATLEEHDLKRIDRVYIRNKAVKAVNDEIIERLINGGDVTPEEQQAMFSQVKDGMQEDLSQFGNQRFFVPDDIEEKTWKDILKDIEWDVEVDVSGESVDREALTTINTVLQIIGANPSALQDPNFKLLFTKAINLTGAFSPMELSEVASQTSSQPSYPQLPPQTPQPVT